MCFYRPALAELNLGPANRNSLNKLVDGEFFSFFFLSHESLQLAQQQMYNALDAVRAIEGELRGERASEEEELGETEEEWGWQGGGEGMRQ